MASSTRTIPTFIANESSGAERTQPPVERALMTFALLIVLSIGSFFEFATHHQILKPEEAKVSVGNLLLLYSIVLSKSLWLCVPGLAVAFLFSYLRRPRAAWLVTAFTAIVYAAWVSIELPILQQTGNHVHSYLRYARDASPWEWAGGSASVVWPIAQQAALWILSVMALVAGCVWFRRSRAGRRLALRSRALNDIAFAMLLICLFAPYLGIPNTNQPVFVERAIDGLPASLPFSRVGGVWSSSQAAFVRDMNAELRKLHEKYTLRLHATPPVDDRPLVRQDTQPNVIVIVLESFRHDSIDPRWMPRLHAWSQQGLTFRRHYAGSNCSHLGLFALLHSRNPLLATQTLNSGLPAQLCRTFRQSGYQAHLLSSGEVEWQRMEEFMSDRNFDELQIDLQDNWPDRDLRALDRISRLSEHSDGKPNFVVAFLMSSHYDYRYPPEYEKYTPTSSGANFSFVELQAANPTDSSLRTAWLNTYRNMLGFMDDALANVLERIDLSKNIVVITGDHGESFCDDGTWLHSSRLSEWQARVPMLMVGAGVPRGERTGLSMHVDILPTLVHAITNETRSIKHSDSVDQLASTNERKYALLINVGEQHMALINATGKLHMRWHSDRSGLRTFGLFDDNGNYVSTSHPERQNVKSYTNDLDSVLRDLFR